MITILKKYILWKKNKVVFLGISIFLFIAIMLVVENNYSFYNTTIAKVIKIKESFSHYEEGPNKEEESYYTQNIELQIKNGLHKDKRIKLENTYSYSAIKKERYQTGDDVFLSLKYNSKELTGTISGIKRDKYVAFLFGIFVIGIILVSGKQGILTLVSLFVNISIFIFSVKLYTQGKEFNQISIIMLLLFSSLTLIILGGITRKAFGAIVSTLLTVAVTYCIYRIVIIHIERPPYELMDYIVGPKNLSTIFMAGIVIGSLGAVMDVAITINSAVHELVSTADDLTLKQLIKSIREIGYDIMGTMINVLLFTYISGSIPIAILKIKNGYSLFTLINFNIVFEITRFLVGSIGIILAIPISGVIAVVFLQKGKVIKNVSCIKHYISCFNYFSRWRKRR